MIPSTRRFHEQLREERSLARAQMGDELRKWLEKHFCLHGFGAGVPVVTKSDVVAKIAELESVEETEAPKPATWDPHDGGNCPHCGCDKQDYDLVQTIDAEGNDISYDVIDCPRCGKRLWEENH